MKDVIIIFIVGYISLFLAQLLYKKLNVKLKPIKVNRKLIKVWDIAGYIIFVICLFIIGVSDLQFTSVVILFSILCFIYKISNSLRKDYEEGLK